ncbi:hypothetical protein GCM10009840_16100 [Pseudolysinimonas kribbensis]|uniref:Uncharacterized protein n=1 Tax=Pseudolysinimonas kribbensis TaxID=433641 RepID=A0ABQ6K0A9_9MICO|nr:hypothetical protein GCM10025881_08550 [Pseudolysinimonas kribbensis]
MLGLVAATKEELMTHHQQGTTAAEGDSAAPVPLRPVPLRLVPLNPLPLSAPTRPGRKCRNRSRAATSA